MICQNSIKKLLPQTNQCHWLLFQMSNYQDDKENKKQLQMLFDDCILNFCRVPAYYNQRCFEIETHIEEASKDLAINHIEKLDQEWRKYSGCGNFITHTSYERINQRLYGSP